MGLLLTKTCGLDEELDSWTAQGQTLPLLMDVSSIKPN